MTNPIRPQFSTLVEALQRRSEHDNASAPGYVYLVDGAAEERTVSYRALDAQARAIAARLQQACRRGARAVLLYPPDLDYIAAFFGCLYAGVVAVPAYPPDPNRLNRTLPRLQAIVQDADADLVLTTAEILHMAAFLFSQAPEFASKTWVATDVVDPALAETWKAPVLGPDDVAFLQYTSGSTGVPKGVILTHGNLLHNLELISNAFEIDAQSTGVSWLPPYHDMGLIGGILAPLYRGRPTALMSPVAFLQRPIRWLEAISRFHATISGGPNFAYDLCVRKVSAQELEQLDLRSWSVAFCGAEPIRSETIDNFVRTFGPCGFRRTSLYPCYGLAEATLIVTGGTKGAEPAVEIVQSDILQGGRAVRQTADTAGSNGKRLVACGHVRGDQQLLIVDPVTLEPALPGDVGEVWVSGPSVARGYWRQPEATQQTFEARHGATTGEYLRTGDLGFLRDGVLFITGRLKDLVIIRGRNHYPQDIERTAETSHPSLRRGCCAAFAAELQGQERLVVAVEVERRFRERRASVTDPRDRTERRGGDRRESSPVAVEEAAQQVSSLGAEAAVPYDPHAVCEAIRRAVMEQHDLSVHEVLLVTPGTIPKTSSGKIQRNACRIAFLDGSLELVASNALGVEQTRKTSIQPGDVRGVVRDLSPAERREWLEQFLKDQLSRALKTSVARVDTTRPLSTFGLDSLLAVELAHRIEKRLGVAAAATAFLRDTTLRELAATIDRELLREPAATEAASRTTANNLSAGQQALWFLHELAPESGAYNLSCAFRVPSGTDLNALREAFLFLVERHEVLRTVYPTIDGRPTRQLVPAHRLDFNVPATHAEDLDAAVAAEAIAPFDLERGPVARVTIHPSAPGPVVQLVAHHIAIDLWSMVLLLNELGKAYDAISERRPVPLPPAETTYSDFVHWQEDFVASRAGRDSGDYWVRRLRGADARLELPADKPRPRRQTYNGAALSTALGTELVDEIRSLARALGTTPYVILLSTISILLGRFAAQDEVVIGSPLAARPRADFDRVVGYFVNVLPLRIGITNTASFSELVASTRTHVLDTLENQHYPLARIVERLQQRRDPSRSPVFQAFFALEKEPHERDHAISQVVLGVPSTRAKMGRMTIESVPVNPSTAQFDLSFVLVEQPTAMTATLRYNTDVFDSTTVSRIQASFVRLLREAVATPNQSVHHLELLDPGDRDVLGSLNRTDADSPSERVDAFLRDQAASNPHLVAVAFEAEECLSYAEVLRESSALAGALAAAGVVPGDVVGLCVARSARLLVGLCGIWMAGAVCLPLDPDYPLARLEFMLSDSGARVLLAEGNQTRRTPSAPLTLDLGERGPGWSAPTVRSAPKLPAYLIYTSGSTGKPKGVLVSHLALVNLLAAMQRNEILGVGGRLLAVTSLSFDIAMLELLLPLVVGGTVVVARSGAGRDGPALRALLTNVCADAMQATPSVWAALLFDTGWCSSSITALCGGEALTPALAIQLATRSQRACNMYGPTETTVWSSFAEVRDANVSVGVPIANTRFYALDDQARPLPLGMVGELAIAGAGLADGYWDRPDLTATRFCPDPFAAGERAYRTGDRGRWRADRRIECLGRLDHQLKLRGFRVEPGEIAASILEHERVRDAVVVPRVAANGDFTLVAYVVPALGSEAPAAAELRDHLRARLPEYMVPNTFVALGGLPLLPNGKVDRGQLSTREEAPTSGPAMMPRTPLETAVAGVWADALGRPALGMLEDFFELGGHSLVAARAVNHLRDGLGIEIPITLLFEHPTVASFCEALGGIATAAELEARAALLIEVLSMTEQQADAMLAGGNG